jgi:hypothetical protein
LPWRPVVSSWLVKSSGKTLSVGEPYLPADCIPTIVPDGSVYLLADNRGGANQTNPVVDADRVQGRMVARLWNAGAGSWCAPPTPSDAG